MSYVISYTQYAPILTSEDEDIVKDILQHIFELLVTGKRLQKSKRCEFTSRLECFVSAMSAKVRKWAYHCACFYQNEAIIKKCKDNLLFEDRNENILWALTALSIRYNSVAQLRQCVPRHRHEEFLHKISPNYIENALTLFTGSVRLDIKGIISENNSSDLAALTKVYGYPALRYSHYPEINAEVISELRNHKDSYVREYAYWSLYQGGTSKNHLLDSPDVDLGTRKWQIAVQFESADTDFIIDTLKPLGENPHSTSREVKEGVLKGLGKIPYMEQFVPYIYSWYELEDNELICFLLIDYMLVNCQKNRDEGTFIDVLNDALSEDNSLSDYIQKKASGNSSYNLEIKSGKHKQLIFSEGRIFMPIFNIGTNQGQINVSNDNSSITAIQNNETNENTLQTLIENILRETQGLTSEDVISIREELEFIKSEISNDAPKKNLIDKVLTGLKAVKGSTAFAASVASLIQFVQKVLA